MSKDHWRRTREHIRELPVEMHERLYMLFFSALLANEEAKNERAAEFTRRQIEGLLLFGKVHPLKIASLERDVRQATKHSLEILQEVQWSERLGVPIRLSTMK